MTAVYKSYNVDTGYLFPPSLADFLGADDQVHIFKEITEHLDISYLDSDFNGMGQHPYHPLMLLRLLMWGLANEVVSTRRIEVLTRRDVSFIYLAGGQKPDYRTLARFRRRNSKNIERLFKEAVLLCARLGMVRLGHIALDGTKLKANSSKHKAMSYGRMKEEEARLGKEIEELMKRAEEADGEEDELFGEESNGYNLPEELQRREARLEKICRVKEELENEKREEQGLKDNEMPAIADREQRSFADKDARIMLMKRGDFDYAYNAQACVDEAHGVIVAANLTNQASDMGHLPEIVAEVRELRDEIDKDVDDETKMTADSGYFSAENIKEEGNGIELLIAPCRENRKEPDEVQDGKVYSIERFCYYREEDLWECPGGHFLSREANSPNRYVGHDCHNCRLRRYCLKPGEEQRVLAVNGKQLICGEMRVRMRKPESRAIYRKRKWVGEQVFGQIKEGMKFREFTMRGKPLAKGQWLFICAGHNIMKAVRFIANLRGNEINKGSEAEALLVA